MCRTRLGLEPLLLAELSRLSEDFGIHVAATGDSGDDPGGPTGGPTGGTGGRWKTPEGKEAEGVVEVRGPWERLYWILRCSLVQSVWVRVGPRFECEVLGDLEAAVRKAPWEDFLDRDQLGYLDASDPLISVMSFMYAFLNKYTFIH